MKNFPKRILAYIIVFIFLIPNCAIGFIPEKKEQDEEIYRTRTVSNTESDYLYHYIDSLDSPLNALFESCAFVANFLLRPFLGSHEDTVDSAIPKQNYSTSVQEHKGVNFQEHTNQKSIKCDQINSAKKDPSVLFDVEENAIIEQSQPSLLLPVIQENKKTNAKQVNNKGLTPVSSDPIDYTQQIALGQKKVIPLPKQPYADYFPIIETLIQKVIQDKIAIPVKIHVLVDVDERQDFHGAFEKLVNTYTQYPSQFSWSKGNKGYTKGEKSSCIFELTLVSHAKKREQVENYFRYQISQKEAKKVNWMYVYDVAMRSRFTLEDFKFNNAIKIRLLDCQEDTEEKILGEFQQFLLEKLGKDHYPFHIIGIFFNPQIKKDQSCILGKFLGKVSETNVGLSSRGTVFDPTHGMLYLCLDNGNRRRLDLHGKALPSGEYEGRSVKVAREETKEFMMQAYETFQKEVSVCTGRGNHINTNNHQGALRIAFNDWIQDEQLAPLIKASFLCQGGGEYKVIFVKPRSLNLKDTKPQNIISAIKKTIFQMIEQNNKRLYITLGTEIGAPTDNLEFKLLTKLYADLKENAPQFAELLLPISCESTPGEMKIIFNQQHSKSRWGFSFFHSHGSTGFYGTIRKPGD